MSFLDQLCSLILATIKISEVLPHKIYVKIEDKLYARTLDLVLDIEFHSSKWNIQNKKNTSKMYFQPNNYLSLLNC